MNDILYATLDNVNVIKVYGKATMKNSQAVLDLFENSDKIVMLDLSETTYIDSTFLGLIAKYTMEYMQKYSEYLSIIKPTDEVLTALKQTGILKFIVIINEQITINGVKVENNNFTNSNIPKHILEMHEILAGLNEENAIVFNPVVEQLRKVVEK
ncbi:STAS domain-containing protein [Caviibacter abscessus]|uniref:STAS domain-containing protein n=1 Tax=Caviibacter abscessus TaxID=1766719 RepID=UPI00082B2BFB|nr:STAS domain-containing protein [Caviibacter abscessus]